MKRTEAATIKVKQNNSYKTTQQQHLVQQYVSLLIFCSYSIWFCLVHIDTQIETEAANTSRRPFQIPTVIDDIGRIVAIPYKHSDGKSTKWNF